MKKLSILAAFALSAALILSGCNPNAEDETADGTGTTTETTTTTDGTTSGTTDDGATSTETGSTSTDSSTSGSTVLADKVIWEKEAGEAFTTKAYDIALSLDEVVDLTGYKYLNVEFASPDNAASGQNVIVQPMSEQNGGGHPQGNILQSGAVAKGTFQTKFGTTYGKYTDWSTGEAVEKEIEDDKLGSVQLYVQETTNWGTVDGVVITVYKITATNTELK